MSDVLEKANLVAVKAEFCIASEEEGVLETALDDAFALADLSGVHIDEDGKVHGIKEAVQALAESKPFLFTEKIQTKPRKIGQPTNYDYPVSKRVSGASKSSRTKGKEPGYTSVYAKAMVDKRFREDLERLGIRWR